MQQPGRAQKLSFSSLYCSNFHSFVFILFIIIPKFPHRFSLQNWLNQIDIAINFAILWTHSHICPKSCFYSAFTNTVHLLFFALLWATTRSENISFCKAAYPVPQSQKMRRSKIRHQSLQLALHQLNKISAQLIFRLYNWHWG